MRVRSHVRAGDILPVQVIQSAAFGGPGPGLLQEVAEAWTPQRLRRFWNAELRPWLVVPDPLFCEQGVASASAFSALDDRLQDWVGEWIDPCFGQAADGDLTVLGLASDGARPSDQERFVNRHLVAAMGSLACTVAGLTVLPPLLLLGAAGTVYSAIVPASAAYRALVRRRELTTSLTTSLSILFAWAGGYHLAAALGTLLFTTSEKLLHRSQNRARGNLASVFGQLPRKVWLLVDGVEVELPIEQVQVGDRVAVQAGQAVPVDGRIVRGVASIDQRSLTGESRPVERGVGDQVLATTLLLAGSIHIEVEQAGRSTVAGEISRVFDEVSSYQRTVQAQATQFADRAVPGTLLLSASALPFWGAGAAIALLRLPLGTSLRLTAPITMLNALNFLARQGILVKDARSLEILEGIDTVVFDKTGTLTLLQPRVTEVRSWASCGHDEVLALAALAEQRQSHPIALAILDAARLRGLPLGPLDDAQVELGLGVRVRRADSIIRVGSARYLALEGILIPIATRRWLDAAAAEGDSVVLVAKDATLVGGIRLQAGIRPEARDLIAALRRRKLQLHILSGDDPAPTRQLADALGVDHYRANVLPQGKAAAIAALQDGGRSVCFIGDGINDGIALKTAHVSVSLRGSTAVALDAAQIVFMQENLLAFDSLLDQAAALGSRQRRSFRITEAMRLGLLGGVGLLGRGIYWSLAIMGANTAVGLLNAIAPFGEVAAAPALSALPIEASAAQATGESAA